MICLNDNRIVCYFYLTDTGSRYEVESDRPYDLCLRLQGFRWSDKSKVQYKMFRDLIEIVHKMRNTPEARSTIATLIKMPPGSHYDLDFFVTKKEMLFIADVNKARFQIERDCFYKAFNGIRKGHRSYYSDFVEKQMRGVSQNEIPDYSDYYRRFLISEDILHEKMLQKEKIEAEAAEKKRKADLEAEKNKRRFMGATTDSGATVMMSDCIF